MKTVLIGYMASGKSAVGKQLAIKLNQEFIDLDTYIELKEKKIFQKFLIKRVRFILEK